MIGATRYASEGGRIQPPIQMEYTMRPIRAAVLVATAALLALVPAAAPAQFRLDVESGMVVSGYNEVRIPGDTGTDFSLSEDLSIDPDAYLRVRLDYSLGARHTISALYAPLTLTAEGTLGDDVHFAGEDFPSGTGVEGTYTFNSYRLTYRYTLKDTDRFEAGIGFTAKIRDAAIKVEGGGLSAEKTNVGFVPLLNFRLVWAATDRIDLLLEGDALAAPQGRAEDVIAGALVDLTENVRLRIGYRIVEGGADNDEVYNFALLNYASAGLIVSF
jgi:opacity protein-like surface antigen